MSLLATALTIAAFHAADVDAPTGAAGGVRDPAGGTLELAVLASDGGSGLRRATAALDGAPLSEARYEDGASTGTVVLRLDTTGVADGPHRLTVAVEDVAGNVAAVVDRTIVVANAPVRSTAVEVTVGSAGTPEAATPHGCAEPALTMVRVRRSHRFRGRLTCAGRPAPRGTLVEVSGRAPLKVRAGGRIAARLAYGSSRAITFRAHGAGGDVATVRIASSAAATAGR